MGNSSFCSRTAFRLSNYYYTLVQVWLRLNAMDSTLVHKGTQLDAADELELDLQRSMTTAEMR